ncbi:hypothetical protein LX77_00542 [Gelidibacter algens]|jgi:arsenate reductase-like glutaredoxin family protein|uniref:Arsenate reductase n=1 Tax=Gelidibacter algens TaxID=49280 RepID=A0A1A7R496_9FLAO|nr:hypothetical protein [Gelidibacter algens]OBX27075.1 hypothetical protein A9996_01480 [Gelidibacter algens]RAJ27968.1 hypothetical protein LX77_00542 [Gelidibacter algens]
MGVISTDKNEIKLFFHSESSIGKQVLAYVLASEKKILTIDISKTNVTGTQWVELAKGLGVSISDLIDQEHPDFVKNYGDHPNLDQEDWLKLLDKQPEVLTKPIAIIGNQYVQLESEADFVKYIEPDSKDVK